MTNSAILELAGSVSALSSSNHRVDVINDGTAAAGVLVSGTNQQVGGIDGGGTTQVNAGSDLTANHIIQNALMIGGTADSPAVVTIAASNASGNPLGQSSGLALGGSLTPSDPLGAGDIGSAKLPSSSVGGDNPSPVPEPSTLLLMLLALSSVVAPRRPTRRDARE